MDGQGALQPFSIHPVTPAIGAEIRGLDLAGDLDDACIRALREAWLEHVVLFFRDQHLSAEQHVSLACRFGEPHLPAVTTRHGGPPELVVLNQTSPRGDGADRWHSDEAYLPEPPMGTILKAVELPEVGGDTLFANMAVAYDLLPSSLKAEIEGMQAVNDITPAAERAIAGGHMEADLTELQKAFPPCVHPVVRTHPETGRKTLYVNTNATTRILGISEEESERLLALLFSQATSPDVQCRFRWRECSVAFFDNQAAQHYAVPDYTTRRVMHRVTIRGDKPY
jgi:taurine dioxygenase